MRMQPAPRRRPGLATRQYQPDRSIVGSVAHWSAARIAPAAGVARRLSLRLVWSPTHHSPTRQRYGARLSLSTIRHSPQPERMLAQRLAPPLDSRQAGLRHLALHLDSRQAGPQRLPMALRLADPMKRRPSPPTCLMPGRPHRPGAAVSLQVSAHRRMRLPGQGNLPGREANAGRWCWRSC